MNKNLLALAIGAAVAMPMTAQAAPSVYGKMNVTVDNIDNDTGVPATSTTSFFLNSNASRLGFKGEEETSILGLKAIYLAEFGIRTDDGTGPFSQRNIFVGLKGDWGTLRAGRIDTPLKDAQAKFDQFNDLAADITNIMPGETRASNIIEYASPTMGGIARVNLALLPSEAANVDGVAGIEEGITDMISASVTIESGALYGALAMDLNMPAAGSVDTFTSTRADITRLVGGYKTEQVEVGLIYQMAEEVGTGATGEDTAILASGAFMTGDWKFKAQYGTGEGDVNGRTKTLLALGADYKFGKASTVFGYYASVDTDNVAPAVDTAVTTIGIGIDQKF